MNVLFIMDKHYSDLEEVRARIMKGQDTDHVTYLRRRDFTTKAVFDGIGARYEIAHPSDFVAGLGDHARDAYDEELLNRMDFIIVYATEGQASASVAGYYLKMKNTWPYSSIWGKKINVTLKKKPKRKKKESDPA